MVQGLNPVSIQLVDRTGIFQNSPQLDGKGLFLLLAQTKPGQHGHMFHFLDCQGHCYASSNIELKIIFYYYNKKESI